MLSVLVIIVVIAALIFDYINGFHDTANAIATVVSTRVLTPRAAVLMAAVLNFAGALTSQNVAKTISKGIVMGHPGQSIILAAILGAIVWNLVTWRYGIPSSSSHAIIGGLCGAAIASGGLKAVQWASLKEKVLYPLVISPLIGFVIGLAIMGIIFAILRKTHPGKVSAIFRRLQLVSAAFMAFFHGQSDAQKSMGIITLALVSANWLIPVKHMVAGKIVSDPTIPIWVILACAIAMALGTYSGGWKIIHTMGHKIIRLEPVHGFAAETAASIVLLVTAKLGMSVSTTHVISGSIFGVGASKRLSAVRWGVAQSMIIAWILTIPATATVAALCYLIMNFVGLH